MQLKIGSGLFLGGSSKFHLSPSLQGLDSPAIRVGDGVYAGRDGGYVSGHFYGQRIITIGGFYIGDDCDEAADLRKELLGYMRIRYSLPIVITDFGGNTYYTEGFIKDVKATIDNPKAGQYQITLVCPDSALYELEGGLDEINTWKNTTLLVGTPTVVNNGGNIDSFPVLRLTGTLNNPVLTNLSTNQTFSLDLAESVSDDLVIDIKHRLVTFGGQSISRYRTIDSSWWALIPGQNEIELTGVSSSGVLSYQYGRSGI